MLKRFAVVLTIASGVIGCNTIEGLGKDVAAAGTAVERAATQAKAK